LFAGGDVPKERFSKTKTDEYSVPIYSNGIEDNGLYGYTDTPKVTDCCITISGRGTIGHVERRSRPFFPVIRLLVAIPILPIDIAFLSHFVSLKDFKGNGGAIPQLTVPMIKNEIIPLPPLSLQQSFAEKIEAIEKQKALIKQSITEVETLFNSRMDYYFN
jgi:restriction endonuclease S subunit